MWLLSRLCDRTPSRNGKHDRVRRPRAKPAAFRPRLEALEGRDVPSTLTVTSSLDNGAPGTLRAEIAAAKSKDTIVFAPGVDGATITLTSGQLEISKNVTIQGPGAGLLTIDGDLQSRIFQVDAKVTVTLSGMTISNGYALSDGYNLDGGGILNLGTLTVSSCVLSANAAYDESPFVGGEYGKGGGIYNAGTLTVSNSTLIGNQATYGGGFYNAGTATISGCTLTSPSPSMTNGTTRQAAYYGGGIYNGGTLTVSSCTFSYNDAIYYGGAIFNQSRLTVSNSVFNFNLANRGSHNIYGLYTGGGGNTYA